MRTGIIQRTAVIILIQFGFQAVAADPTHLQNEPKAPADAKERTHEVDTSSPARDQALQARREIEELIEQNKDLSLEKRLEHISAHFLGRPYDSNFPLGEGEEGVYSKAPLFRTDAFDCTTYVETVWAIALSKDFADFKKNINRVRYKNGKVSFMDRNHFPSADWIPNNQDARILEDITAKVAGDYHTLTASAEIDKDSWTKKLQPNRINIPGISEEQKQALLERLHDEGKGIPTQTASIPYISLDTIFEKKAVSPEQQEERQKQQEIIHAKYPDPADKKKLDAELSKLDLEARIADSNVHEDILNKIPSGTLLNIVRPNWDLVKFIGTHMNVSHQGLVIQKDGVAIFRHATTDGKVEDVPLKEYLSHYLLSPTIKGINLDQLKESQP